MKKYPSGEFTAQAQARVKELYEERDWQKARDADTPEAYQAFLKQYPEGKWTEEARIRVENFTLAQAPSGAPSSVGDTDGTSATSPHDAAAPTPPSESAVAPPPVAAPKGLTRPPVSAGRSATDAGAPPVHAAANKSTVKGRSGAYGVQLGAFKSGAGAARARWAHLQKRYPTVLASLSTKVSVKHTSSGSVYRLQAMGLTLKHARAICGSLAAKAQPCLVVSADHG